MISTILFDLDGTLIDSQAGITRTIRAAAREHGLAIEDTHDLTSQIGSSLWSIYSHLFNTEDRAFLDQVVATYRRIYREGAMHEYEIYDGAVEALEQLVVRGYDVVLATAKAETYAKMIIEQSPFADAIMEVYGSEEDGRRVEKTDLIKHVLESEGITAEQAVMVGDRRHDFEGARANGVMSIGVSYGYGKLEVLAADRIINKPHELLEIFE